MDKTYRADVVEADQRDKKLEEILEWLAAVKYQIEYFDRSLVERKSLTFAIDELKRVRPRLQKFDGLVPVQKMQMQQREKTA